MKLNFNFDDFETHVTIQSSFNDQTQKNSSNVKYCISISKSQEESEKLSPTIDKVAEGFTKEEIQEIVEMNKGILDEETIIAILNEVIV